MKTIILNWFYLIIVGIKIYIEVKSISLHLLKILIALSLLTLLCMFYSKNSY